VVGVYVDICAHFLLCPITKIEKKEKIHSENEIILLLVQKCAKKIAPKNTEHALRFIIENLDLFGGD
jgi:hypothetical protein